MGASISINARVTRAKSRYYVGMAAFFMMITAVVSGLYFSTLKIEYIWRWHRIPRYFVYQHQVEIRSELTGDVQSITREEDEAVVRVGDGVQTEDYRVPADGLRVSKGDMIFAGDVLGGYSEWRPGILLDGLWITLKVSFISIIFGILIGLITGLSRVSGNPAFKWTAITYIELIRGSPLLVQIFIWYFAIGTLINNLLATRGITQIPPLWFGVAALAFFAGAYVGEIVRAGIQSIHRGQMEAARSLGMSYPKAMRYVILPQAFRRILPPLAGQFISLIKDSSLLGIIAIRELTKATREVVTTTLQPFELWFVCALLYLVLTFTLSLFVQYLERRAVLT